MCHQLTDAARDVTQAARSFAVTATGRRIEVKQVKPEFTVAVTRCPVSRYTRWPSAANSTTSRSDASFSGIVQLDESHRSSRTGVAAALAAVVHERQFPSIRLSYCRIRGRWPSAHRVSQKLPLSPRVRRPADADSSPRCFSNRSQPTPSSRS